jgi:hypothetical protein
MVAGMSTEGRSKLLIDPVTATVATPDLQRSAGCDEHAAWRFPLGAMTSQVTAAMRKFSLTEAQLIELIAIARARTGTTLLGAPAAA